MARIWSSWRAVSFFLMLTFISGCATGAEPSRELLNGVMEGDSMEEQTASLPSGTSSGLTTPTPVFSEYAFPTEIDINQRFMFYLHGKIIEDQGVPAISPEFGEYQYEDILKRLQSYGFVVISEQRSKDVNADVYIDKVTEQVNDLLNSGVAPGSITVVGASKGGVLAIYVSDQVSNQGVNYVLLGACNPSTIANLDQTGIKLVGNVLSIYDSSDTYASSCKGLFELSEGKGVNQHEELVVKVGTGHGILYKPLVEWILPTVAWANQDW